MDAARQHNLQEEEQRTEAGTSTAAVAASGTSVDMSTILAAIQAIQGNQEASRRELQELIQNNQNLIQANQETVIGKIDTGIAALGEKMKNLESEMKDVTLKVETHDNQLQALNKEIIKLRSREPIAVASSTPVKHDLPRYDGTSSWAAFKYQLEILASGNAWSDDQTFMALALALRGDALMVLENLPPNGRTLKALKEALESRYGENHLEHVYRAQLRDRAQKTGESLQQWAAEVERMVRRAFASNPAVIEDQLVATFMDGIKETDVRSAVLLGHHKTLNSALAHALEVEAVRNSSRMHKVRAVVTYEKSPRYVPTCYGCGEKGHIKLECPKKGRRVANSGTQVEEDLPLN